MTPSALRLRAALVTIAVASTAQADGDLTGAWFLGGGYAGYSRVGSHDAFAYGAEASVMGWTKRDPVVGGWLQVGRVTGAHAYTRAALGAEVMLPTFSWIGLELGAARLWLDGGQRAHQLAVAPFVSLGLATLSLRFGIPLDSPAVSLGFDGSLVVTLKFLPYPFGDPGPSLTTGHGRPFSCGSSSLASRADWA